MTKEEWVTRCIDLLEGNYSRETKLLQTVEIGLWKMNNNQLSCLYSVLLTRVVVKPV